MVYTEFPIHTIIAWSSKSLSSLFLSFLFYRFGTFLCNTLLERRRNTVSEKTRSVWDYLEHHHVKFRNFLFETRLTKEAVDPLWPRCEVRDLLLWKDVYVVADVSNSGNGNGGSSGNTRSNGSCNRYVILKFVYLTKFPKWILNFMAAVICKTEKT